MVCTQMILIDVLRTLISRVLAVSEKLETNDEGLGLFGSPLTKQPQRQFLSDFFVGRKNALSSLLERSLLQTPLPAYSRLELPG